MDSFEEAVEPTLKLAIVTTGTNTSVDPQGKQWNGDIAASKSRTTAASSLSEVKSVEEIEPTEVVEHVEAIEHAEVVERAEEMESLKIVEPLEESDQNTLARVVIVEPHEDDNLDEIDTISDVEPTLQLAVITIPAPVPSQEEPSDGKQDALLEVPPSNGVHPDTSTADTTLASSEKILVIKKSFSSSSRLADKTLDSASIHLEPSASHNIGDDLSEADVFNEDVSSTPRYGLTIVIPTRNERDNVEPLLQDLKDTFTNVNTEIVFVDDSDDDTPDKVKEAAIHLSTPSFHIHLEHRVSELDRVGGLATAVTLGLQIAQGRYIAVIDADLQHPPAQLRVLYDEAIKQEADLVIASRYLKGGSSGGLNGKSRLFFSVGLKWVAKVLFPGQLSGISDPLSGFFLLKGTLLKDVVLRPIGYKILLEILLNCPWREIVEIPYHFQPRQYGKSKADFHQGLTTLQHMARLFTEVPKAGRIWKISALLLFNLAVLVALFFLYPFVVFFWQPFSLAAFAVVALINLLLLNRLVLPSSPKRDSLTSPLVPVDHALTAVTPAIPVSPSDADTRTLETVAPPQTQLQTSLPDSSPTASLPAVSARQRRKLTIKQDKLLSFIAFLLVLTAMGSVAYMALDLTRYTVPNIWVIFVASLVGLSITIVSSRKKIDTHRTITMLLAIAMGITFIDYVSWRIEVINWSGWWIALPLLFAECLGAVHTLGLQFTLWPRSQPRVRRIVDPTQAPIFIFIPTVNEGISILEPTIRGALTARDHYLAQYPWGQVNIVICNDGYVANIPDWQTVETLAHKMGVQCVTRKEPGGAKAGNIENARQLLGATGDALIVIFDADQVASADFLLKIVPNMADPRVGWVQTGQYYRNLDNPVTHWADDQQSLFYNLLCPGKATWNATFICGTNVMIRAKALDEIGGLPQDSVTEDFAASINLHTRWQSIYLTDILATGLGPMDLTTYLKQQRRWSTGTLGVLRTHWRDLFLPKKNGLRVGQRLQYFLACTHYLCGLRDLLYLLCPILFIFTGIPAVQGSTLTAFVLHFIPYFLVSFATIWYAGRGITGLRGIIMGFGSFPVLIESLITVILQRKVGFSVTSKKRGSQNSSGYLWIYLFFVGLCLFALAYSSQAKAKVYSALAISLLWVAYTLVMLCSFLWLYFLDWRKQKAERQAAAQAPQPESYGYPARFPRREQGLRSARNFGLSLVLASILFVTGTYHSFGPPAPAYPLVIGPDSKPYLGVDLPVSLLKKRPALLEQKLGSNFAIVGRTQEVNDFFDIAWANNLAAHHASPWITIQFGLFQANGKPANDSSLLSIAEGLHDDVLKRWALAIRAYGKPVFITILLHADRNWSLSSGVANGGIPQDVPRAWLHVESLFKQMGANNVSWLWSPADPIHDQPYAPPAASISGVVLDLISYPNTKWGDPQTLVQSLMHRYPGKPIIMDVSVAGPAAQKAIWLSKVGTAAISSHAVYALIYHDASPSLSANARLDNQWSMASDPESLAVMRQISAQLQHQIVA